MAKRRGSGEGSIVKRKTCKECGKVQSSSSESELKECKKCKAALPKNGNWMGAATVGFDVEKGKPQRKYFYGKTRAEVAEKMNEALGKVKNGTYTEPSKMLFAEWLDTWINEYMEPSLRPTTWASYQTQVEKHIKPSLGHIRLSQLQTSHLQKLYNEKIKGGRADGKPGGLSPRSVKYIHTVIHSSLEQAKLEYKITFNPADAVKLPKQHKKEMSTLDINGIRALLKEAANTNHYTTYILALTTGLRRGELLGLRWKDTDLNKGTITVSQGLVRVKGKGLVFQEPKTGLSNRTINIPPNVVKELKAHKSKQAEKKLFMGPAYEDNDLVFAREDGKPIDPRGLTRHFERALCRAGLPKICFHDLRHTYATLSLEQGVSVRAIQETLGHHDAGFTMSVYTHVTDKMKQEATDKIGNLLTSCLNE